jgi:F0F1-type ATP synthase assembly protein I
MHPVELEGIFAIVLSMTIPILGIVFGSIMYIRKKQSDTELRRMIIENHTDLETAKALMAEQEKKPSKYTSLRWACVLIGMGLGAFADILLGFSFQSDATRIYFLLVIAFGIGLGLLVSFFIEQKMQKKELEQRQDE